MYCTNNAENDAEVDEVEAIDLCCVSQNKNEAHVKGKKEQSKKVRTEQNIAQWIEWKMK